MKRLSFLVFLLGVTAFWEVQGQTLEWICRKVVWITAPENQYESLRGKRVVVVIMSDSKPSEMISQTLNEFATHHDQANTQLVVIQNYPFGDANTEISLIRQNTRIWFAEDEGRDVLLATQRNKVIPYCLLVDKNEQTVWEGRVDASMRDMLFRFAADGSTPPDPSRYFGDTSKDIHIDVRASTTRMEHALRGVTLDGTRCWIRNCIAPEVLQTVIEFLSPMTNASSYNNYHPMTQYDVDVIVKNKSDRLRIRDSVIHLLDSVLATTTVPIDEHYMQQFMIVKDTVKLLKRESQNGETFQEFAQLYRQRFHTLLFSDTSALTGKKFNFNEQISQFQVDRDLDSMGIDLDNRWHRTEAFHTRASNVPESEVVYQLDRTYLKPTIGATLLVAGSETWYGGEFGVWTGDLSSGHGFYGIYGYRSCVEVLTNGNKVVAGINAGIDLSSLFVLRLRGGVYSDFTTNTTLILIPEFGFSHNGRYCVTLGGHLPVLGSNTLPPSFRLAFTFNLLPDGAK